MGLSRLRGPVGVGARCGQALWTLLLVGVLFSALGAWMTVDGWEAVRLAWWGMRDWVPVQAVVVAAEVDRSSRRRYGSSSSPTEEVFAPRITYAYTVRGRRFESDRYSLVPEYSSDEGAVRARVAAEFAPGTSIRVYVDPEDPSQAVIDRDARSGSVILAVLGVAFSLGGLAMLVGAWVQCLGCLRRRM